MDSELARQSAPGFGLMLEQADIAGGQPVQARADWVSNLIQTPWVIERTFPA
jgi:hypothetical protein